MNLQDSKEQIHPAVSQKNEDIQSILNSLAFEETCMANEIYALAERLRIEQTPEHLNTTGNSAWIQSFNRLDSDTEDALSRIIQKEIVAVGKIENALKQSSHSVNPETEQKS